MSDKNFQLEDRPHLDLETSKMAAASHLSSEMWSMPENRVGFGKTMGDLALSTAAGGAAGTLVGVGLGAANDTLTRVVAEVGRVPMSIALTAISGRAVMIPSPITIESSIPRIGVRGGLIGAAATFAAVGAYELYQHYSSKDK